MEPDHFGIGALTAPIAKRSASRFSRAELMEREHAIDAFNPRINRRRHAYDRLRAARLRVAYQQVKGATMTTTEQHTPSYWAEQGDSYDCTGFIGPINPTVPWPMYSFERPAFILWNAIAAELYRAGWSDERIQKWLQSKEPRWMLDGSWTEQIEHLGTELAKDIRRHYSPI